MKLAPAATLQFFRPAHGYVEIPDEPVRKRVNPAVNGEFLATCPRVGDEDIRRNIANLPDNVEFA